jgi:hypothetical protein
VTTTRRIGLSLGADLCWPKCFEDILARWNPTLKVGGETQRFEVERVTIEPFDLRRRVPYDVVIDRLTHWYANTREWIKKAILLDDLYVFNNPWSVQSMEKQTTYCAMMRLGMPVPETWMVPPKDYEAHVDLEPTLKRYARYFDLETVGGAIGYPLFMKPYDGGGWVGVTKIDDVGALKAAYEQSGKFLMHLQKGVWPWEHFVRCVGVGPQLRVVAYDPDAPLHARYTERHDHLPADVLAHLRAVTLTINAFFGWDFNSCELLARDGVWHPIDYANPCPDSQVTSLHRHFPWLVLAKMRWALFCAATGRPFRKTLDWQPFLEVADTDASFPEKLARYSAIAEERLDTAGFEAFREEHLGPLEEVAWEYFGGDEARNAVRKKVAALYPAHEVDEFTDRFWAAIQTWRAEESAGRPA